jgi:hypothetical protein
MISVRMSMNGVATGTSQTIIPAHRSAIRRVRSLASGVPPAEVPGAITSKFHAAPPAPAFLRSSNTLIMDFGLRATIFARTEISERSS